jgi:nucleotide-binding universal stress UspA family protein
MRILACIDLSPISERIAREAASFARAASAELTLVHAARTEPVLTSGGVASPSGHRVPPSDLGERRARMEALIESLRGTGVEVSGGVKLTEDAPDRFIVREAAALGASYIVIGSHGHGRIAELLVGSVTSGVIRASRLPVLLVPAD